MEAAAQPAAPDVLEKPASVPASVTDANPGAVPDKRTFAGKRCFVVMPYGKRGEGDDEIDFDDVYNRIIKPAVEQRVGLTCHRADLTSRSGLIHREMIEDIIESDAVIVDITHHNPNVFYELGIRHAARRSGTVVIRSVKEKSIPFNINGLRIFEYDPSMAANDATQKSIATTVANSLADQAVDSLVYQLTASSLSIKRIGKPIGWCEKFHFSHKDVSGKKLGIVTGDVCNVKGIDVWVNPENTRMQMGRVHDESFSACVRYLGGRKDIHQRIVRDLIQDELDARLSRSEFRQVEAGGVVPTRSGKLARSHGTRRILHVAAMNGEPTKGYQLIQNYPSCVTNALREMDRLNRSYFDRLSPNWFRGRFENVVFPLLGTRENRIDPHEVAYGLVLAATNYLEDHPESRIKSVYFLAFTDVDKALAEHAFRRNEWKLDAPSNPR